MKSQASPHTNRPKHKTAPVEDVPMTPMIDVVFQLLVYFVVTFETPDIITHLQAYRPSTPPPDRQEQIETNFIKVAIFQGGGFTINEKVVSESQLRQLLFSLADLNPKQTILLMCSALSEHQHLIAVMDLCAEAGLDNLSVVSTG